MNFKHVISLIQFAAAGAARKEKVCGKVRVVSSYIPDPDHIFQKSVLEKTADDACLQYTHSNSVIQDMAKINFVFWTLFWILCK